MVVHRYEASELARVLQGVRENGTILLAGEGGVGKSTAAAQLATAVAHQRSGLAYWLDHDQLAHDLIVATFDRVHAATDRVVLVEEGDPRGRGFEPLTWENALAQVPANAACVVVDSLETWAGSYAEQAALARVVAAHPAAVKLVLCGTNSGGQVEGRAQLRRVGDAIVVLHPDVWDVRKCRWLPGCPRQVARLSREDEPPAPDHSQD
jgi:predicted ATP-dependent serine protease